MLKINKNYVPPEPEESRFEFDFETSWTDWNNLNKLDAHRYVLDTAAAVIDSSRKNFSHFEVYQYKKLC